MARKRIEGTRFGSWDDVNDALKRIGEIDRDLKKLDVEMNAGIDRIKAAAAEGAVPLVQEKEGLEIAMKEYSTINRPDFGTAKTKVFTFGSVSFRASSKIVLKKKAAEIIKLLKVLGHSACVKVKESLNKEEMKKLDDETLTKVGAGKKPQDVFGYEVNVQKIQEAA